MTNPVDGMTLRPGSPDDIDAVMALLDEAIAWLTSRGRSGQWGDQPWSDNPRRVERITGMLRDNDLTLASVDGRTVGIIVVGSRHPVYVSPPSEPERYIQLLVTARAARGSGVGTALLDHVRSETRSAGIRLLRVDSYAGDDQRLVEYYVGQGFTPTETFARDQWQGQVYEQWLDRDGS